MPLTRRLLFTSFDVTAAMREKEMKILYCVSLKF